ncbi:hypothetical protein [Pseudomonas putida]|nr:hypothetical protein [Pseudomonas putida]
MPGHARAVEGGLCSLFALFYGNFRFIVEFVGSDTAEGLKK